MSSSTRMALASPEGAIPLSREESLYRLTPDASGGSWDLLRVAREFDSSAGDLTEILIGRLNEWAAGEDSLADLRLKKYEAIRLPREILFLDGSPNRLPLTAETARIAAGVLAGRGLDIPVHVINRRDELMTRVARAPREILVLSQSAQRSFYNARLAEVLVSMGTVSVPGPLTAPDGPLSNKEKTYDFLNGGAPGGEEDEFSGRLTARYRTVETDGRVARATAEAILDSAAQLNEKWDTRTFFVKPRQGGGGIGCFRIDVFPEGFSLPDLSRLGIAPDRVSPLPLSLDPENGDHVRVLAWLANRFAASPATSKAYLHASYLTKPGAAATRQLAAAMKNSAAALGENLRKSAESKDVCLDRLARAIENYQQLFGRPYHPLICDWIDFGLFSVRVHLRLGRSGPRIESLYARLFPVEFTDETVGSIGVDSIANLEGNGMEFNRYVPLLPQLVGLVGGAEALCEKMQKTFFAFRRFLSFFPPGERERMPVRAEFDISP